MDQLLEAREAAKILGIGRRRIYLLGRRGVLPGVVHLGERQVRFNATALRAWIAEGGMRRSSWAGRLQSDPKPTTLPAVE